jgi:WD40 repeat protein
MENLFDAFISYGRADSLAFGRKLYARLLEEGFKIWFDQNDIPLGVDFQNQIDDGIEKAHNFLFLIAPHSVNSPYCLKEIELAIKRNKRIIPLLHVEQISRETWQQRDGTIKLWNQDGTLRKTLLGHSGNVYRVIFSPDKRTLVSASDDASIKVWGLDGRLLRSIQSDQLKVLDISFSPDGKTLASSGEDGTVKLWNSANGTLKQTFHANQCNDKTCKIWGISFSSDGKFLATGSENSSIKLWTANGTFLQDVGNHKDKINELSFSPNCKFCKNLFASVGRDRNIKVWSLNPTIPSVQPKTSATFSFELLGHTDSVENVSFSPDGKILASASMDKTVKLWNIDRRKPEELWHGNEKAKSMSFSPDSKTLVSASHTYDGKQGNIRVWHLDNNSQYWNATQTITKAHKGWIRQVRFSGDGQRFASASEDGTIKLWNRDGQLLASSEK